MAVLTFLSFAVLAVLDWFAVSDDAEPERGLEVVAKPAALAALLLFATTGANPSGWLIAALVLSLLGDVYLMQPGNFFVAGLSAFLFAHLAYIANFDAALGWRVFWWGFVLLASLPVATRIFGALQDDPMRPAVLVYMAVISFMVGSAVASGSLWAAAGAVLFFASDSLIAWNRFVAPLPRAQLMVMVTYHLGQLGLVLALRGGS